MNFTEKYDEYKALVENALVLPESPLKAAAQYSLDAGGKRIRPVLVLAFCEAHGGDVKNALPVAVALELLHTSTLIQDDLPCMDNDDFRRGKPSCHKAFSESDAVLAASAMAYDAIAMINDIRIVKAVCGYMRDVYDGQKLDLDGAETRLRENLLRMYELKTCALLQASCVAGCLAAGADENAVANASEFALNLGLAFQLVDDILDGENYENARDDAEKYTREALVLLEKVQNNEFLTELTKTLLNRKN